MKITPLSIADVLLIEPNLFHDERGWLYESFNSIAFKNITGIDATFVQDNHVYSKKNVLRGLHYQIAPKAQAKLIRVIRGEVFDVVVDLRKGSLTYRSWVSIYLSETKKHHLWIPEGFAHGFLALSEATEVLYKTTNFWSPMHERLLKWDDKNLGITWPLNGENPVLSKRDSTNF
jgi:dTDP-4-dehydrorhamnose 3,5-epimerase